MLERLASRGDAEASRKLASLIELSERLCSTLELEEVLHLVCVQVVRIADLKMSWVGLVEEGSFKLRQVAAYGSEEGVLSLIKVTWDDLPYGQGPTGKAIKTRRLVVQQRIDTDPRYAQWRERILERGYRSAVAIPLLFAGEVLGAINVYSEKPAPFAPADRAMLMTFANYAAIGIRNAKLCQRLKESQMAVAAAFVKSLEAREIYSAGHTDRVRHWAASIATQLGLSQEEAHELDLASQLHDIGKVAIPDGILMKPGPLTAGEMAVVKEHPVKAAEMIQALALPPGVPAIIRSHHERWDGAGYPDGLAGEEIPPGARIIAVADGYDAITSFRFYRPARSHDQAVQILQEGAGTQWDPTIVREAVKVLG